MTDPRAERLARAMVGLAVWNGRDYNYRLPWESMLPYATALVQAREALAIRIFSYEGQPVDIEADAAAITAARAAIDALLQREEECEHGNHLPGCACD